MATAYVSTTGTAAYPGTASLPTSISTALSSAGAGDIINIAPGNYTVNNVTYTGASGTAGNAVQFIGNPTGSLFTGIPAGRILFTATSNLTTGTGTQVLTLTSKNYVQFRNITFDRVSSTSAVITLSTCDNLQFSNCVFFGGFTVIGTAAVPVNHVWENCGFIGAQERSLAFGLPNNATTYVNAFIVRNCFFLGFNTSGFSRGWMVDNTGGTSVSPGGGFITNCTFLGHDIAIGIRTGGWSASNPLVVQNCLFVSTTALSGANITNTNCRFTGSSLSGSTLGTGSTSGGILGADMFESLLYGLPALQPFSSILSGPNTSFGTSTNAPVSDMYGVTWTGTSPDAGFATYRTIGGVSAYAPTERNASAITIAPGSTSQSIELYLGVTGLTFATSGLAAYYVRNQSAPVAITLVTQTPTGAWTSGGFAEISSSLVPGVYRLDVPNAAFAAGASDVTIVVRGASGTNGAVLTVTLSSGGLTAAQTAAAVWDESRASHTTAGTFGQYVNAELVTPVTSAALVRMGPFEVRADGLGASDPLDIQKGAQHGIDIQCVDNNGAGIDITSATVTAKVYNSGATLVDTYSCTATYAADGRAQFTIDTTVTNTPGTYTATITRSTTANDTQVFGPLRIYVRDI